MVLYLTSPEFVKDSEQTLWAAYNIQQHRLSSKKCTKNEKKLTAESLTQTLFESNCRFAPLTILSLKIFKSYKAPRPLADKWDNNKNRNLLRQVPPRERPLFQMENGRDHHFWLSSTGKNAPIKQGRPRLKWC